MDFEPLCDQLSLNRNNTNNNNSNIYYDDAYEDISSPYSGSPVDNR